MRVPRLVVFVGLGVAPVSAVEREVLAFARKEL